MYEPARACVVDAAAGVVLDDLDPASAAVPDDPPLADAVGAVASVDDSVLPAPDHAVGADILRFPALDEQSHHVHEKYTKNGTGSRGVLTRIWAKIKKAGKI